MSAAYTVTWADSAEDADRVLAQAVRAALGSGDVRSGRLCPVCGSSDHGRPWAEHDGVPVPVSVSRAGAHLVVAVAPGAQSVGVDVEQVAQLERSWPSNVLAAGETAATVADRLAIWVAKEAILKADGTGVTTPMDQLEVAAFTGELVALDAPSGFGAAVALRR